MIVQSNVYMDILFSMFFFQSAKNDSLMEGIGISCLIYSASTIAKLGPVLKQRSKQKAA